MSRINLIAPGTDGTVGGPGGSPIVAGVLTYTSNAPLRKVISFTPAQGAEWSLTVPVNASQAAASPWGVNGATNGLWVRIASGYTTFTTNSAIASRYPGLQLRDDAGVQLMSYMAQGPAYPANVNAGHHMYTRTPTFIQAGNVTPGFSEDSVGMPAFPFPPGWTFGSLTGGLQTTATGTQPGGSAGPDFYGQVNLLLQIWTAQPVYSVPGPNL